MAGVKKSRASHTGTVTRVWDRLRSMPFDQPEEVQILKLHIIKKDLQTLTKTEAGFETSLEEARDFAPTDEAEEAAFQEEEDEVADTFSSSLTAARTLGEQLLACKAVLTGIGAFKAELDALHHSLDSEPDQDFTTSLTRLQSLLTSLKEQWTDADLPYEHPIKMELNTCYHSLTAMEGKTSSAKARATGPITISTPLPTPKEMEMKLPTIEIPTFHGDTMKWHSFWTGFTASVDSRKMPLPHKLAYLRMANKDKDSQTLMYSPHEGPNFYYEAVEALKLRFDRKKEIHRKLVQNLVTLPTTKNTRTDLRKRVDDYRYILSSLKHTGHFDLPSVLTSLLYATLPVKLQTLWDQHNRANKEVSPIQELLTFVSEHAETLPAGPPPSSDKTASSEAQAKKPNHNKKVSSYQHRNNIHVAAAAPTPYLRECLLCAPDKHPLYQCPKWGAYSLSQKTSHISAHKLCSNCLAGSHSTSACKSNYRCKECQQKHHTSIHQQQAATAPVNHSISHQVPDVLMTTANLLLLGPGGTEVRARALIDSGAGISLVTNRIAQILHLPLEPARLRLSVAQGETSKPLKHTTTLHLSPLHDRSVKMTCHPAVAPAVTADLPSQAMPSVTDLPHLMGLPLADTTYNQPGRIDILLGADMASSIMTPDAPRQGKDTEPMAQATKFGWALSGPVPGSIKDEVAFSAYHQLPILQTEPVYTSEPQLDNLLKAVLQEQDEPGDATTPSTLELHEQVENHYLSNTTFSTTEGRYTVALPRRDTKQILGESKSQCVSRFLSNEKATIRKGTYPEFQKGVKGYLTPGHAEEVLPEEKPPVDSFYMPMHAVYKDSSSSTKLRIVFDGSATTSSGLSLNQLLLAGPTIQATLTDTLLKFRSYPIALNADVAKMFREIKLAPQDKDLHRFVWREHPSDKLKDYRMTRVTFGVSASPFLAIRTLHQIADDQGEGYPEATQHLKSSFYVDDFLGGADTPEEAILLFHEIRNILSKGGFQLRKWRSSSEEVLRQIPTDLLEKDPIKASTAINSQTNSKALGLIWDSQEDVMSPSICIPSFFKHTKRGLVSAIYRTYDVLGWISPTTLQMKIMIQHLWKTGHGWDIEAPPDAVESYQKWRDDLPVLREKTLPRCYSEGGYVATNVTLHGFADASQAAYGAVVYYRTVYLDHPPTTVLVTSKTKLA